MDLTFNNVLFFNGMAVAVILGMQLIRLRAFIDTSWMYSLAATTAASVVCWLWLHPISGCASIVLQFGFIVIPMRINASAVALFGRMQYERALGAFRKVSLVHPSRSVRQMIRASRAALEASRGDFASAAAMMNELRSSSPGDASFHMLFMARLLSDWEAILEKTGADAHLPISGHDAFQKLSLRVRALAETARFNEALALYTRIRNEAPPALAEALHYRGHDVIVLAFAGRIEAAKRSASLLRSEAIEKFWTATAILASGNPAGREMLESLLAGADEILKLSIRKRLEQDWTALRPQLSSEENAALDAIEADLQHYLHVSGAATQSVRPVATWALSGMILAGFATELANGGPDDTQALWRLGAFTPQISFSQQLWRAPAAMFLHLGWVHVTMNLIALLYFGKIVERGMGRARFLVIYALSGLLGYAFLDLIHPGSPGDPQDYVGASGAIMGVLGANAAMMLHGWKRGGAKTARSRFFALLWVFAIQIIFDRLTPQVAGSVHIAGIVVGFAVAMLMLRRPSGRADRPQVNGVGSAIETGESET